MKPGEKRSVQHRINQSAFSGAGRTGLEQRRRRELYLAVEAEDVAAAKLAAVYLKPAPTNSELRGFFMSPAALALKKLKPMFTSAMLLLLLVGCSQSRNIWTEAEVRAVISEKRNSDWYPVARGTNYAVHTLAGRPVPSP